MGLSRSLLLFGSENRWLKETVPKLGFVKKAARKFIPGENLSDAIQAAKTYKNYGIFSTFTHLGENILSLKEAKCVTDLYIDALNQIELEDLNAEISLKLTQIGLNLSVEQAQNNFEIIAKKAAHIHTFVWIDIEGSEYTDSTIEFYQQQKKNFSNIGICLQSYLFRTKDDFTGLLFIPTAIRLVKGAYNEPEQIAFKNKKDVDQNFLSLAIRLLKEIEQKNSRAAFATHDPNLIKQIQNEAKKLNISRDKLEFQMLYGIKTEDQYRLANEGYKITILVSYGKAWYSWYMRRLAERPANIWFVLKNLF